MLLRPPGVPLGSRSPASSPPRALTARRQPLRRAAPARVTLCQSSRCMRIVFVSPEVAPYSKVGGLADVLAALPQALAARGHQVMTVTPRYAAYEGVEATGVAVPLELPPGLDTTPIQPYQPEQQAEQQQAEQQQAAEEPGFSSPAGVAGKQQLGTGPNGELAAVAVGKKPAGRGSSRHGGDKSGGGSLTVAAAGASAPAAPVGGASSGMEAEPQQPVRRRRQQGLRQAQPGEGQCAGQEPPEQAQQVQQRGSAFQLHAEYHLRRQGGVDLVFVDHPLFLGAGIYGGPAATGTAAGTGVYTYTEAAHHPAVEMQYNVLCQAALAAPLLLWERGSGGGGSGSGSRSVAGVGGSLGTAAAAAKGHEQQEQQRQAGGQVDSSSAAQGPLVFCANDWPTALLPLRLHHCIRSVDAAADLAAAGGQPGGAETSAATSAAAAGAEGQGRQQQGEAAGAEAVRQLYRRLVPYLRTATSAYCIHNLAYQGLLPALGFPYLSLAPDAAPGLCAGGDWQRELVRAEAQRGEWRRQGCFCRGSPAQRCAACRGQEGQQEGAGSQQLVSLAGAAGQHPSSGAGQQGQQGQPGQCQPGAAGFAGHSRGSVGAAVVLQVPAEEAQQQQQQREQQRWPWKRKLREGEPEGVAAAAGAQQKQGGGPAPKAPQQQQQQQRPRAGSSADAPSVQMQPALAPTAAAAAARAWQAGGFASPGWEPSSAHDAAADSPAAKGGGGLCCGGLTAEALAAAAAAACPGQLNLKQGALLASDALVTVSPGYAREVTEDEGMGCGLREVIAARGITGIMNGIDTQEWDPATDPRLPPNVRYTPATAVQGKARAKALLQERLGLRVDPSAPLVGFVGRLTHQKGVDVMLGAAPALLAAAPVPAPAPAPPLGLRQVPGSSTAGGEARSVGLAAWLAAEEGEGWAAASAVPLEPAQLGGQQSLAADPPPCVGASRGVQEPANQLVAALRGGSDAAGPGGSEGSLQLVVLGTGEAWMESALVGLSQSFRGQAAGVTTFSEELAHLIMAGADYLLVPSRFEPCGLVAQCAARYGAVPIVAAVGGLKDLVTPQVGYTIRPFGFDSVASSRRQAVQELIQAVQGAVQEYGTEAYRSRQRTCMALDMSWARPAAEWEAFLLRMAEAGQQAQQAAQQAGQQGQQQAQQQVGQQQEAGGGQGP